MNSHAAAWTSLAEAATCNRKQRIRPVDRMAPVSPSSSDAAIQAAHERGGKMCVALPFDTLLRTRFREQI
jgi:CelD/BcsL family acetyltransferase involved in cellulose biosynthesis